jgi:hypothetical protein
MKRNWLLSLAAMVACAAPAMASTTVIESWENTLDGWTVPPSYNAQAFTPSFVTTPGVTNGTFAMAITGTGTGGPNYGQLLEGPTTMANTSILGNASAINLDVDTPAASFGFFLQFQFLLNNADTGFVTLNSSYVSTNIGSETTLSVPIPSSVAAQLATSTNPTGIFIQVGGGFSGGNETMFVDNLTATNLPEPASAAGLLSIGALSMLRRRRA